MRLPQYVGSKETQNRWHLRPDAFINEDGQSGSERLPAGFFQSIGAMPERISESTIRSLHKTETEEQEKQDNQWAGEEKNPVASSSRLHSPLNCLFIARKLSPRTRIREN
ncbi:unnamed protein product [Victoria cruziana]